MAPHVRRSDHSLIEQLRSDPQRFALLQAVRLAEMAMPSAVPVGEGFDPRREALTLRGSLSQSFPASDVISWSEGSGGEPPALTSAFLSLGGAFGPLPPPLSELALERQRRGDTGMRDFLDGFNHRLMSLFIRAKRAHRPVLQQGRPEDSRFAALPWALLGLGTAGLRRALSRHRHPRLGGQERSLLACVGLLNQRPVSAHALERLLSHVLGLPVAVVSFVGRWLPLDPEQITILGQGGQNAVLGQDAVLGKRVWDQSAAIRVEIGPMPLRQMKRLLPGAADHAAVLALLGYALCGSVDVEMKLMLPRKQVPVSRLWSGMSARLPRLGWTSWLTTRPRRTDGDILLQLGRPGG